MRRYVNVYRKGRRKQRGHVEGTLLGTGLYAHSWKDVLCQREVHPWGTVACQLPGVRQLGEWKPWGTITYGGPIPRQGQTWGTVAHGDLTLWRNISENLQPMGDLHSSRRSGETRSRRSKQVRSKELQKGVVTLLKGLGGTERNKHWRRGVLRLSVGREVFEVEHVKGKERCFYVSLIMSFFPNN